MHPWVEKVDRILHPHQARQEQALARLREYRELSSLALESGNEGIYSLYQKEMNIVFMEFLTWCFFDGIGSLIPHIVAMWLLNLFVPSIKVPFNLPVAGTHLPVIVWYPALAICYYAGRWIVRKNTKNNSAVAVDLPDNS
ncbi:MAG: hypothetical protein M0Z41_09245 [Peptococcaceae bacterium]|nr:hypothetical protein [Peptococcaceae bacterium]